MWKFVAKHAAVTTGDYRRSHNTRFVTSEIDDAGVVRETCEEHGWSLRRLATTGTFFTVGGLSMCSKILELQALIARRCSPGNP